MKQIAALFVMTNGAYFGLPGVDPWDAARDARRYPGPHPVVAHPPCERWGRYWGGGPSAKIRRKLGDDDGCFESALASVRRWGGVLEHPNRHSPQNSSIREPLMNKSTICLNMIVRDEAHIIARCLKAAKPHIDTYVIVDTGSTDNTKEVIRRELEGIEGEIIDRPWVNFEHNRNEAIELAKSSADYLMIVDADDEIIGSKPLCLEHDEYHLRVNDVGTDMWYVRPHIIRSTLPYRYRGRVHEYLSCDQPIPEEQKKILPNLIYRRYPGEGARSKVKEKFLRDAAVLEQHLIEEPNHPDAARHVYYLAQSYRDAGEIDKAIEVFERRATMGGWAEEAYVSLYYLAGYTNHFAGDSDDSAVIARVEEAYLRAHKHSPHRAEPIFELCDFLNKRKLFEKSFELSKPMLGAPIPTKGLFVHKMAYDWGLRDVHAVAAFYLDKKDVARHVWESILNDPVVRTMPPQDVAHISNNLKFCGDKPIGETNYPTRVIERNQEPSGFGDFLDQMKKNIAAGGTELGTMITLFALAVATRAETIVEIGRFKGASTYVLASALKFLKKGWCEAPEAHQRPGIDYSRIENGEIDRKLYSIDIVAQKEAHELVTSFGLDEFVEYIDKPSQEVSLNEISNRKIDLCFIDGDHSYDGCMNDVLRYTPWIREGGYFILHDYVGWMTKDGKNGSPIKKVCDAIADDFENILIDTHYMSFMIFRKRDKVSAQGSIPAPAVKAIAKPIIHRIPKKHWSPIPTVTSRVEGLIQPGWKVLEIGPGAVPFSKATHFVERPNNGGQFVERPNTAYRDVNVSNLPFADKEFDFVYSRHCVEDLFNPDLLLKEMSRVSKRGYIETPSAVVELTRGVDGGLNPPYRGYIHHRWVLWEHNNHLNIIEKSTCVEHMDLEDHATTLSDPFCWNMYFLWSGELKFHHWQHDIDFKLHENYRAVLEDAVSKSIDTTTMQFLRG